MILKNFAGKQKLELQKVDPAVIMEDALETLALELKKQGMYENSLIVVTADHGAAFLEHGDLGHHALLYEENIRVPLLIKYPDGFGAGTKNESIASLVDVGATITEALGVPRPTTFIGKNLRNLASKKAVDDTDHVVVCTAARFSPENFARLNFEKFSLSVRTRDWKLISHGEKKDELYRLDTDPKELNNLREDTSLTTKQMYRTLQELMRPYMDRLRSDQKENA